MCLVTCCQRVKYRRGRRERNTVKKPGIYYLSQVIKVNVIVVSHVDCMYFRYDVMKMALYLCGFPLKNQWAQISHEKNPNWMYESSQATIPKSHRPRELNRHIFSQVSGGWKSNVWVPTGLVSGATFLAGLQMASFSHGLSSMYARILFL